jgi:hypothetical protein
VIQKISLGLELTNPSQLVCSGLDALSGFFSVVLVVGDPCVPLGSGFWSGGWGFLFGVCQNFEVLSLQACSVDFDERLGQHFEVR